MNTVIGDKLQEALQAKKNDINSYIWKMARKEVAGQKVQQEIRLETNKNRSRSVNLVLLIVMAH